RDLAGERAERHRVRGSGGDGHALRRVPVSRARPETPDPDRLGRASRERGVLSPMDQMIVERPAPGGPAPSLQELIEGPANLVTVLWRRRRLVATCMLACLGLAGLYVLIAPRLYQASARLLVLQQGERPLNVVNTEHSRMVEATEDIIP